MKSLKWLGVGSLVLTGALVACANGSTVTEDEQNVTTPADDASTAADTFRPSLRDSSTVTGDSSTTADAGKPDAPTSAVDAALPDAAVIPDASAGLTDCDTNNPFLTVFALAQITRADFPACNSSCGTCCWNQSPLRFCLKP